ncbi:hypothetical protein D3C84_679730 [compost metagenome]
MLARPTIAITTEFVVTEVAFQLLDRVMLGAAVLALLFPTGGIAQLSNDSADLGKLMPHPRCEHRVTARDAKPGKRIGMWPAQLIPLQIIFQQAEEPGLANFVFPFERRISLDQKLHDCRPQPFERKLRGLCNRLEYGLKVTTFCSDQCLVAQQLPYIHQLQIGKRGLLVLEKRKR